MGAPGLKLARGDSLQRRQESMNRKGCLPGELAREGYCRVCSKGDKLPCNLLIAWTRAVAQ